MRASSNTRDAAKRGTQGMQSHLGAGLEGDIEAWLGCAPIAGVNAGRTRDGAVEVEPTSLLTAAGSSAVTSSLLSEVSCSDDGAGRQRRTVSMAPLSLSSCAMWRHRVTMVLSRSALTAPVLVRCEATWPKMYPKRSTAGEAGKYCRRESGARAAESASARPRPPGYSPRPAHPPSWSRMQTTFQHRSRRRRRRSPLP